MQVMEVSLFTKSTLKENSMPVRVPSAMNPRGPVGQNITTGYRLSSYLIVVFTNHFQIAYEVNRAGLLQQFAHQMRKALF